jgi:hypothetical protein
MKSQAVLQSKAISKAAQDLSKDVPEDIKQTIDTTSYLEKPISDKVIQLVV